LCVCVQWCRINTSTAKLLLSSLIYFSHSHGESVLFATSCISQMAICSNQNTFNLISITYTKLDSPPGISQARGLIHPSFQENGKELSAKSTSRTRRGVLVLMAAFMQVPCHLSDRRQDASLCALPGTPRNIAMGSGLVFKEPSLEGEIFCLKKNSTMLQNIRANRTKHFQT